MPRKSQALPICWRVFTYQKKADLDFSERQRGQFDADAAPLHGDNVAPFR